MMKPYNKGRKGVLWVGGEGSGGGKELSDN
jgi:hypothetical protein